jgi:hypothetical protein
MLQPAPSLLSNKEAPAGKCLPAGGLILQWDSGRLSSFLRSTRNASQPLAAFHLPRVNTTFTVVSTSTGSPLSR